MFNNISIILKLKGVLTFVRYSTSLKFKHLNKWSNGYETSSHLTMYILDIYVGVETYMHYVYAWI